MSHSSASFDAVLPPSRLAHGRPHSARCQLVYDTHGADPTVWYAYLGQPITVQPYRDLGSGYPIECLAWHPQLFA
ncbi:hypothetical protein IF1G_02747 [Cordyceps javanica]|uniref:Uncharacterized protein n=1 Tax=Cordyceps javanica TaxID=43265 RepID=A0A545VAA4_9HYPO|nr:hypothetical protein IF1G_02747 [Cordyceps javanica]